MGKSLASLPVGRSDPSTDHWLRLARSSTSIRHQCHFQLVRIFSSLCHIITMSHCKYPFLPHPGGSFFWDGTRIEVIIYYGPKMFTLAGFPSSTAIFLSAGISACQMISTLLLSRLVDKVGRKPMSSSQLTDGCPLGPWRLT